MMKSMPGLPKLHVVQHLADYMVVFGIKVESGLTQSWKSTCETWTVYQWHAKRLNHYHTSCLRKLLKIKWQDRIPDTEVLKRTGMQSVHTLLKLAQLKWAGHVTRMPEQHLPKKILYGELEMGKRSMVIRRRDTKTPSKPPSRIATYQRSHGNKLHRTEQGSEASSEKVLVNI